MGLILIRGKELAQSLYYFQKITLNTFGLMILNHLRITFCNFIKENRRMHVNMVFVFQVVFQKSILRTLYFMYLPTVQTAKLWF